MKGGQKIWQVVQQQPQQTKNGGVGKTTTAFSLGVALANEGKDVLLIDADPQADLTTYMGYYDTEAISVTISTLIERMINDFPVNPDEAILHHNEGVDLIPSNLNLSMTEVNLLNAMCRESAMSNSIKELKPYYDYIIIDCMPSLNMITTNALASADKVIIPVQSQFLSAKGMGNLLKTIAKVKKQINNKLEIGGILLTLVDRRTNLPKAIENEIKENYGNIVKIYDSQIPVAIKTAESSSRGKSILAYDKNSSVTKAYTAFAKEVLEDGEKERRKNALAKGYDR